jgi:hypothetical protein
VPWPPTIDELLPLADEAFGVEEKLAAYCLNLEHELGHAKARGFQLILGIGRADVDYLADALRAGIRETPIVDVRDNAPFGILCEVRVAVAGLREHENRVVPVTTSWELRSADDPPRLVTAYVEG